MKNKPIELEELKELLKQNPDGVELECFDGEYISTMKKIKVVFIYGDDFSYLNSIGNLISDYNSLLTHYKLAEKKREVIELFECMDTWGNIKFANSRNEAPNFASKEIRRYSTEFALIPIPNGRKLYIDAETFEFVEGGE